MLYNTSHSCDHAVCIMEMNIVFQLQLKCLKNLNGDMSLLDHNWLKWPITTLKIIVYTRCTF